MLDLYSIEPRVQANTFRNMTAAKGTNQLTQGFGSKVLEAEDATLLCASDNRIGSRNKAKLEPRGPGLVAHAIGDDGCRLFWVPGWEAKNSDSSCLPPRLNFECPSRDHVLALRAREQTQGCLSRGPARATLRARVLGAACGELWTTPISSSMRLDDRNDGHLSVVRRHVLAYGRTSQASCNMFYASAGHY